MHWVAMPGSDLAGRLNMPISGDTLLRIFRRILKPSLAEPETIGVDDWAKQRGRLHGKILVELEPRLVLDLLPDRTVETLSAWLKEHPQFKIIARDLWGEYARGTYWVHLR